MKKDTMKYLIYALTVFLSTFFPGQIFGGDIMVTVERFKYKNEAPVRFAICNTQECHKKKVKGYVNIEQIELVELMEDYRKYRIRNISPGEYSLSAFHDLNNSGVLERQAATGIPKEAVGFTRLDAVKISKHPKWDEVKFTVGEEVTYVSIHLVDKFGLSLKTAEKKRKSERFVLFCNKYEKLSA